MAPCNRDHPGVERRSANGASSGSSQNPLIGHVRRHLRNAAGTVDPKLAHERQREKYERRIHEELSRLLHMEEEAFFYFSPGGGDVTSWTQRKHASNYWTGLSDPTAPESDGSDTNWTPQTRPSWRQPVWRRADHRFFWNSHIMTEAIQDADRVLRSQGFPDYGAEPRLDVQSGLFESQISDLEGLITPIIQGYVEMEKLSLLPTTSVSGAKKPVPVVTQHPTSVPSSHQNEQREVTVYYSPMGRDPSLEDRGSVVFHGLNDAPPQPETMPTPNLSLSDYPDTKDFGVSSCLDDVSELVTSVATVTEPFEPRTPIEAPTGPGVFQPLSTRKSSSMGNITVVLISRRSRFRAGTRYRRRGIDHDGHVANYVETEQVSQP
ncbi:unnamed protein product [Echinostoma caproni]|uniref:SAC domain-containing protein n=1 Tax=Echinostoma caproni TaxID=27848 RepID=A0A183AGN0_9TREM|nr:unnamed protein product [Echinostoma caproni]